MHPMCQGPLDTLSQAITWVVSAAVAKSQRIRQICHFHVDSQILHPKRDEARQPSASSLKPGWFQGTQPHCTDPASHIHRMTILLTSLPLLGCRAAHACLLVPGTWRMLSERLGAPTKNGGYVAAVNSHEMELLREPRLNKQAILVVETSGAWRPVFWAQGPFGFPNLIG